MNSFAEKIVPIHSHNESVVQTGCVSAVMSDEITVTVAGERIKANKAFSCIVEPEPGDMVMCCKNESGMYYILAILARKDSQKMALSFPDDAHIQTNHGSLKITSRDAVTMASENLNCISKRAIHKSGEAIVSYDNITANGNELQASFKTVRLISNLINTMARQVIDSFKGYIRSTEDNDMVKAGQLTRKSDGLYSVDSKYTIMNSKKSTKIDGEKILMG